MQFPNTVTDIGEKTGESLTEHFFKLVLRALLLARDCQQTTIQQFLTHGSRTEYEAALARSRFYEGRIDEHKSLPHFSFPLPSEFIGSCLSNSLCILRSLFYVIAHCRQQCPSCTPCQERKAQQSQQILFSRGYDPFTHARRARPLTDVG